MLLFDQLKRLLSQCVCWLYTNQQLADLECFCTTSPSVLSVDPTFNLGPFYVTPTTYHNLLVKTDRGNHSINLGPILIHQTKTFQPFHYFTTTLIQFNPRLIHLKAFGTDGEPELIKAFSISFPMLYILGIQFIYVRMSRTNFAA